MDPLPAGAEHDSLKGATRVEDLDRARRAIARRSAEIRATVPELELASEVEVSAALELAGSRGCGLEAVLVRAAALALRSHPYANGAYRDGRYELYSRVNVAVVVHREDDYLAPTVLDADIKELEELGRELELLRRGARDGTLTAAGLAGATFTLADLSSLEVDRWSPLPPLSQAAALSAGAVRAEPVVRDGTVAPGRRMWLTLACDHRILFGRRAAAFLAEVAGRLERAEL